MTETQVLIVGAGPTGLVLALWLTLQGVKVRIVDRTAEPGTTSRALAVQARTLELYAQADLAGAVVERGHKTPAVNLWVKGARQARVDFESIGEGVSPHAFLLIFPQDEHEKLLTERLTALGVTVERQTSLTGFVETADGVAARLSHEGGASETCLCRYIAGCDGARSKVREGIDAGFPGGTYRQVFYVADIQGSGPPVNGELHVDLDEADFLAVFPLAGEGRARLIGTVRDGRADAAETLRFEDVSRGAIEHMKLKVDTVNWFSTYHVHHRVAGAFRRGRAFLLGDAAHIHSPAGGQGMNTGLGDAINLAWKLAAVLAGRADESLLDSYEDERIVFARRLVATTDRAFSFATADGAVADLVRTRLAPLVIPAVLSVEAIREFMFRTIGQLTLAYRDGPLSAGQAGKVHGGDRLPWAPAGGLDNFAPLTAMAWQVHVYGAARPDLADWCQTRGVRLHVFPWTASHESAGLTRNAAYILRPDTYVALADPTADPLLVERYFAERGLTP